MSVRIYVRVTSIYTCSSLLILEVLIKRKAFVIKSDHCDAYIYIFQIHWIWKCICVHMHRPVKYVRINIFSTGHVEEIQQKRVCNILELTKLCAFSSTCVNTVNPSFYLDKTHLMIQLNNFKRGSAKGVH